MRKRGRCVALVDFYTLYQLHICCFYGLPNDTIKVAVQLL